MRFFNFNFARRRNSAPVARERLQILLEYERRIISQSDLVAVLRQEILAVVSRHVSVDPEKVQLARSLEERYPSDPNAPRGAWHVLRTGRPELIPVITDEMLQAWREFAGPEGLKERR